MTAETHSFGGTGFALRLPLRRIRSRPSELDAGVDRPAAEPGILQSFDAGETEKLISEILYGRRTGSVEVLRSEQD